MEHHETARFPPVAEGTGDAFAVFEELDDRALHEDVDALVDRVLLERPNHLEAGAISDVREAGVAVTAEVALEDAPVGGAVEDGAPLLELEHPFGSFLRMNLRHRPVVEELASPHGVAEVHLPVVLGIDVAESRGYPAFGHDRMGLAEQ